MLTFSLYYMYAYGTFMYIHIHVDDMHHIDV